jgi:hypothetical protein
MPILCGKGFELSTRPWWDTDWSPGIRGQHYVDQNGSRSVRSASQMPRWIPSVNHICESLWGTSRVSEDGTSALVFPEMSRRLALYREALEIVIVTAGESDSHISLMTTALFRRQVDASEPIPLDDLFIHIADQMSPALSVTDWKNLAQRMPEGTLVHAACRMRPRKH